ncbi:MAG: class I SAM-dependent methyltransferase [Candidatus Bathyarchaeota archaeon]|jgi:ubiquinone/menaquinone biosynthesis C-methylase UbiE|nr:class I SAM-dependent methyltransferase [Candidatus Bathyarchaeota archaeon A05DMB-3]MDH7606513.1 class I SAM-dependent methyltransferase [Candidatus Bathyarchaeota archaeon]
MNEWNQKFDAMQHYNLTAKTYDLQYAEEQKVKIETALKNVKLPENSLILDIGCGTGLLFEYVADKAEMVVGLDISKKILEQAGKRALKFGNVHLVLADADHAPFKNETFSHLFAITLLQNMSNPEKTLAEIKRVAKREALIIVTGLKKKFSAEYLEGLLRKLDLNIVEIKDGNQALKCYVAVCMKS